MKHRTINAVRTRKLKRKLKNKRTLITITAPILSTEAKGWDSNRKGTYVKRVHGDLR